MEKLISCIVPLYNKEKTIERAIHSVLNQSYQDIELIIINDGSTDRSAEVVQKIDDQRIKLITQDNSGVSAARNKGIELASGEFIAFLDADDVWLPNHLEDIVDLHHTFPDCGAYACDFIIMTKGGKEESSKIKGIQSEETKCIVENYCKSCVLTNGHLTGPVNSSNVVIKKTVFDNIENFKEGIDNNEDLDLWLRISNEYNIGFTWKIGAKIDRTYLQPRKLKYYDERDSYLIISGSKILENSPPEDTKWLLEYINKKRLNLAKKNIQFKNKKKAYLILKNTKTKIFLFRKIAYMMVLLVPYKLLDKLT